MSVLNETHKEPELRPTDFFCYYSLDEEIRCRNKVYYRYTAYGACKARLGIEWFRASQYTVCARCRKEYMDHPTFDMDGVQVNVLCGGQRVKL